MKKACSWCSEVSQLYNGYCFDCHKMGILQSMGSTITFETYEALSTDCERMNCLGFVTNDTLFLCANAPTQIN